MIKIHHLNCGSLCPGNYSVIKEKLHQIQELSLYTPVHQAAEMTKKLFAVAENFPFSPVNKVMRTITPYWEKLSLEFSNIQTSFDLICHCLLIEDGNQLILVDTGLGTIDVKYKTNRLPIEFLFLANPKLDINETALHQVKKLGYDPKDVRHIIATHLDVDHIGGLSDFPWAKLHLLQTEFEEANTPSTTIAKKRYIKKLWDKHQNFELYSPSNGYETWGRFQKISLIDEISNEITLVPLAGHSKGHLGVLIDKEKLFFVGDSYLTHDQLESESLQKNTIIQIYNKMIQADLEIFNQNLNYLKELHKSNRYKIFCSHDKSELTNFL